MPVHLLRLRLASPLWLVLSVGAACTDAPPRAPAAAPDTPHEFRIRTVWHAGGTADARAAYEHAVSRWQRTFAPVRRALERPTTVTCRELANVAVGDEDLTIIVRPLESAATHVAEAEPCAQRPDGTTRVGIIRVAIARLRDAAPMSPPDLFAHEIGHVLGFAGSWFARPGLTAPGGGAALTGIADPWFVGSSARRAAAQLGLPFADRGVPIETGDGGAFAHWRGNAMRGELMAWAAEPSMRLSAVTLAALQDLGYAIESHAAEWFVPPSGGWTGESKIAPAPRHRSDSSVGLGGVEPPTSRLSGVRSNHLSYRPQVRDSL